MKSFLRELKIFILLEKHGHYLGKIETSLKTLQRQIRIHDGLPKLLSFKITKNRGEILMEHSGYELAVWQRALISQNNRKRFSCEMLRQMTPALNKLHNLGYSHCDLKMENICARVDSQNKLQFTLIDFGVCSKLAQQQKITDRKGFRGNFVFSSFDHLVQGRANQIDDLTSLVYVAFKFLFGYLPWERDKSVEKDPKLINKVSFAALRHKKKS